MADLLKAGRYNHITPDGKIATFHLETNADIVLDTETKRVITKNEGEDWNAKSLEINTARQTYPTLNDRLDDFYTRETTDGKYALLSEVVSARTGEKDLLGKFETYWTKEEADTRFNFKHAEADYTYGKEELNNFFKGVDENFVKNINFKWNELKEKPTNLETVEGAKKKADDALASANKHSDENLNTSKTYTDTKVAGLVNSAPGTLDTLKELADALGGDPNFATTVATNISKKSDKSYVDGELSKKLNVSDNAVSATKLKTPKKINGIDFDGSADITTPTWGRTAVVTIGNTKKNINGADATWTLSEIGASEAGHTHTYLPLAGGTLTGALNSSVSSASYLSANKGTAIINSTAAGTGFNMLASMSSTNGRWAFGSYGTSFNFYYTAKSVIDAGTNASTKSLTLLNESGDSSFPGAISAVKSTLTTSEATPLTLRRTGSNANLNIGFDGNGTIKYLGCPKGELKFGSSEDLGSNGSTIWHAGNFDPNSKLNNSNGNHTVGTSWKTENKSSWIGYGFYGSQDCGIVSADRPAVLGGINPCIKYNNYRDASAEKFHVAERAHQIYGDNYSFRLKSSTAVGAGAETVSWTNASHLAGVVWSSAAPTSSTNNYPIGTIWVQY